MFFNKFSKRELINISDILNYKKSLSKEIILDLSTHFKVAQEVFNRPYKLKLTTSSRLKSVRKINARKALVASH